MDQDQIERDAKVALKIQADLNEEARTEIERQEEASKAAVAEMYDEVQAQEETVSKKEQRQLGASHLQKLRSEEDKKRIGSRKKRAAGSSLKNKSTKKHKMNDQDSEDSDKEHRKSLKVVPDDDKAIDYKTLDVKSPIVDCESQVLGTNEVGDIHVYKLTRLDGSYRHFSTFSRMLEVLDRQDVLDLHKIIMERFPANDPEGYDLILWGDPKTLVESSEDDEIWRNQQDWKLLSWKLYETCGVHTLMLDDSSVSINMFVEKRLKKNKVFGYILLMIMKLILKKLDFYLLKIKFKGGLLGFILFEVSTVSYKIVSTASTSVSTASTSVSTASTSVSTASIVSTASL
nr:hypothetical protein [Tanacetum cinerariifolium]